MVQAVSFSARLIPKIDDAGALNRYLDDLINRQKGSKNSNVYEFFGNGDEYYIYGRFENAKSFKQELENGFETIADIFLQNFAIVDGRVFGSVDDSTKRLLVEFGVTHYSLVKSSFLDLS